MKYPYHQRRSSESLDYYYNNCGYTDYTDSTYTKPSISQRNYICKYKRERTIQRFGRHISTWLLTSILLLVIVYTCTIVCKLEHKSKELSDHWNQYKSLQYDHVVKLENMERYQDVFTAINDDFELIDTSNHNDNVNTNTNEMIYDVLKTMIDTYQNKILMQNRLQRTIQEMNKLELERRYEIL